jgi:hypothetical protein
MHRTMKVFAMLAMVGLLGACAGTVKNMRELPAGETFVAPASDEAVIVFLRPSSFGFAIQSSVFHFDDAEAEPELVGIVAAKKAVAYRVEPGEHLFMVVGESADFMSAEVEAGETYYVVVQVRMGVWKARFSLNPIESDEIGTEEAQDQIASCDFVETTPDSFAWAADNMDDLRDKQRRYWVTWMEKPASERPHLGPEDSA